MRMQLCWSLCINALYCIVCLVLTRIPGESRGTASTHEDLPLVEFVCLVFTRMPVESYRARLGSLLLCLCDDFRALINSLVC